MDKKINNSSIFATDPKETFSSRGAEKRSRGTCEPQIRSGKNNIWLPLLSSPLNILPSLVPAGWFEMFCFDLPMVKAKQGDVQKNG